MKLVGFGGAVKSAAAKIPPKVWYALAIIAAVVGAYFWIEHLIHRAYDNGHKDGYAQAVSDIKAREAKAISKAVVAKQKTETKQNAVNTAIGVTHEKDVGDIHARADQLRHYAPQRRVFPPSRNGAFVPSPTAGGHDATGIVALGSDQDLVAVPRLDLISAGEQCEIDRAALRAWQTWWPKQNSVWQEWLKSQSHSSQ